MRNAVIWFMEAQCVADKVNSPEDTFFALRLETKCILLLYARV